VAQSLVSSLALLQVNGVGTYAYVNPIIAVLLGCLLADEKITISQVIGIVVILTAAYLSNKVKIDTSA